MTITIDQLIQVLMKEETDDAGMRAVVRALRDEMCACQADDERSPITLDTHQLWQEFQAILGDGPPAYPLHAECAPSDRGQVAGGSTREDEKAVEAAGDKGPVTVNSPATDPAPVTIKETIAGTVLRMEQGYTGGMNDLSVTPATDPAPAVCEWKQLGDRHGHFTRECSKYPTTSAAGDYCSNCGKPIKFTEAKT